MTALQDYTRLKRQASSGTGDSDLAWSLVLDSLVFSAEAEIRWLDHCEARVRRAATDRAEDPAAPAAGPSAGPSAGNPSAATVEEVSR
jgi:hypothetical protein